MAQNDQPLSRISAPDQAKPPQMHANLWKQTAERAAACACFFDFDGTLAQIEDDPEAVSPVPGAIEALALLARHVKHVVIVSARPAAFLHRHLHSLPQVTLFGLYGLERQHGSSPASTVAEAKPFESIMKEVAARATAELPADILVEYKRLSVALHYRTAQHLREQAELWAVTHARALGLRTQTGRMVIEIKPPVDRDKGCVVAEEIADLTCAWYFGDDLSDLRAFAALDDRQNADPSFVGVKVSVANEESGDELLPAADICLDAPERVPGFLTDMIAAFPNASAEAFPGTGTSTEVFPGPGMPRHYAP